MKRFKKLSALLLSIMMLISALPLSAVAEETAKPCTTLFDTLSASGELQELNTDSENLSVEISLTKDIASEIDSNSTIQLFDLSSDDIDTLTKVSYTYDNDVVYESKFDNGAVVSFDKNMEFVAYSNFDTVQSDNNSTVLLSKNNSIIDSLKKQFDIDNSYGLEVTEDNGDTKYYWSKIGYDGVINPYDSLTVRIDDLTGEILTVNRFDDSYTTEQIIISKENAENIALNTREEFNTVTSCKLSYEEPNFFWTDTEKIYDTIDVVRLVYDITIDNIYKVYVDVETGEVIGGDIIKATNNAAAYTYKDIYNAYSKSSYAKTYLQKLGYSTTASIISTVSDGSKIRNFVQNDTKAYGLYISCHGSTQRLSLGSAATELLTPSQVKGNWHFVFLDACSTAANANWPNAFKINSSYSKRAFLGWGTDVTAGNSYEFCSYFWPETYNKNHSNYIQEAAVWAADQVPGSGTTPIRFYGDRTYNGRAY